MRTITTNDALKPSGHYSQAIVDQGLVYVSGQLPFDWQTGAAIQGTAAEQAEAALTNLQRVLRAADSDLDRVLRCTVYVSDIAHWDEVNVVYSRCFGEHRPARSIVPTGPLHFGFLVEIDAIAKTSTP